MVRLKRRLGNIMCFVGVFWKHEVPRVVVNHHSKFGLDRCSGWRTNMCTDGKMDGWTWRAYNAFSTCIHANMQKCVNTCLFMQNIFKTLKMQTKNNIKSISRPQIKLYTVRLTLLHNNVKQQYFLFLSKPYFWIAQLSITLTTKGTACFRKHDTRCWLFRKKSPVLALSHKKGTVKSKNKIKIKNLAITKPPLFSPTNHWGDMVAKVN